jgi:hypothetical protein
LDLSLFFGLPDGSGATAVTPVTGGYNTGPGGFAGAIRGVIEGTAESGTFRGELTANLQNGCVATRDYAGPLTRLNITWTPGTNRNNCAGASPLNFTATAEATSQMPTTSTSSISTTTTTVQGAGLTGTWTGVLTDSANVSGSYSVNLFQNGTTITGSHVPIDFGPEIRFTSVITGTISGTALTFTDRWTYEFVEEATCNLSIEVAADAVGDSITGTFSSTPFVCNPPVPELPSLGSGRITLTRQRAGAMNLQSMLFAAARAIGRRPSVPSARRP